MKVYLAGGINGLSDAAAKDWRERAKTLMPWAECLDPMQRDYRGIEDQNIHEIVNGDIADIDVCDVVIALCLKPSWGTAMEVFYAHRSGKKVIAIVPPTSVAPVSPWLRFHSTRVCWTLEEAVEWAETFK